MNPLKFLLRFEDHGLKRRLEDEAKLCHRSLNNQIIHILTKHIYNVKTTDIKWIK